MAPSTAIHGPIPSAVMLAKSVVFGLRLRDTVKHARSPRLDQAYRGEIEYSFPSRRRIPAAWALVPLPPSHAKRLSAIRPVPPPRSLFLRLNATRFRSRLTVESPKEYLEKVERPYRGG